MPLIIKGTWILQYDNALSHTAFILNEFLARISITVLPQPPNNLDLGLTDFFLFLQLKGILKDENLKIINV